MNAKKAKALRRLLKNVVEKKIESGEQVNEISYVEIAGNRKFDSVPAGSLGVDGEYSQVAPGTFLLANNSVRGVYQSLKRAVEKNNK
jgi:hypothetical protein